MTDETSKFAVLDFMVLRSPTALAAAQRRRSYVEDDYLLSTDERALRANDASADFSVFRRSGIARTVYETVFCSDLGLGDLRAMLLDTLGPRFPLCEGFEQRGTPLQVEDLERHAFYEVDGAYYLLPDTLDSLPGQPVFTRLALLLQLMREAAVPSTAEPPDPLDVDGLVRRVEKLFRKPLLELVFENGGTSQTIRNAKRALFDALYVLYIMRRWVSVNLEEIIDGLRVVHVIEALAVDQLAGVVASGQATQDQVDLLTALAEVVPQLKRWSGNNTPGLPLIDTQADLAAYLSAMPIIHPLIARLFRYRTPFNTIKPIGIGDLKVVKQWLTEYRAGEIAHIENVVKKETRRRTRRSLEKTEDVFTSSSELSSQLTTDTQTTDRFELKSETETVAKGELAVNSGSSANFEYSGNGYKIVKNRTAGFAFNESSSDASKLAGTFAHDIVEKAVSNVQSRSARSRVTTVTGEAEETSTHRFDNSDGTEHISGIYRWVDKIYTSQVYNYGKRLMFEFVLPEPAALFVESRLAAYESSLQLPKYPQKPAVQGLPGWLVGLLPEHINEVKFRELALQYDLSEFSYPQERRSVDFIEAASGRNYFSDHTVAADTWDSRTYMCRLEAKGYRIETLVLDGLVFFRGRAGTNEPTPPSTSIPPHDINTFRIWIDGYEYFAEIDNTAERWYFAPGDRARHISITNAPVLDDDEVTLTLGFMDGQQFDLSVHASLVISVGALRDWQQQVYRKVRAVEEARVAQDELNAEQSFQADLATYRNRIDDLRALAVEDLIQGQSEGFNREIVLQELKRQCLSAITKEMDAVIWDDMWADQQLMGSRTVSSEFHRFKLDEAAGSGGVVTSAEFELTTKERALPVPYLEPSKAKGQVIQFLEQAFEWRQLSYITYPYFWTVTARWYELLSRSDRMDSFFSAFLRAGSVRVLLAVTPSYNNAVLHYLATGEPWEGGPSPVIGDPLFVPLYDEVREQQDDLRNATPDGGPWTFSLPTALVYLEGSSTPLPELSPGGP